MRLQLKDRPIIYNSISPPQLNQTKWLFFALCSYLISQGFTVPVLPIGHWAIWPCFSDLALLLIVCAFLKCYRFTTPLSSPNQKIFLVLTSILLGSCQSYLFYLGFAKGDAIGSNFGAFQIYRLVQYFSLFWLMSQIPLTEKRLQILRKIVDGVLIFVCLGVFLTYAGTIPLSIITNHLPPVGAWQYYASVSKIGSKGLGFVGYNHAYVAAQIMMLIILRMHLTSNQKKDLSNFLLLLLATLTVFISESRSGFGAILFLLMVYLVSKPTYALSIVSLVLIIPLLASMFSLQAIELNSYEGSIIDRQLSLASANQVETLSGRDARWSAHLAALDDNPVNWIFGNGFGSAIERGDNAHMLYLQITSETGLIGLFIFITLFSMILFFLYKRESKEQALFWGTVIFLITGFSQETFYPEPALGQFLGLYLSSVAIVLRDPCLVVEAEKCLTKTTDEEI
jgi:O-antigen ligase